MIIPLKERVADDYFDPVQGILRKVGLIKREKKLPMDSVPNEQTKIHTEAPRRPAK